MTADGRTLQAVQPLVASFLDALPARSGPEAAWAAALPRLNEAITVPTQVLACSRPAPGGVHPLTRRESDLPPQQSCFLLIGCGRLSQAWWNR